MKYSVAVPVGGLRGAGLGNQLIPTAKAWLGSAAFGARFVGIPWALNGRSYRRELESSRFDWVAHAGFELVGKRTGVLPYPTPRADYLTRLREFYMSGPPRVLLHDSGMEGGYFGVKAAAGFLSQWLLHAPGVKRHVDVVRGSFPGRRIVAVHIRGGDFGGVAPGPGQFNRRLPWSWYQSVIDGLVLKCGADTLAFVVISEAKIADDAARELYFPRSAPYVLQSSSAVVDLMTAASADLLVCSVSSFSMGAAFLSGRPYIYFGPGLTETDGWLSIWGWQEDWGSGPTSAAADVVRTANCVSLRGMPHWEASELGANVGSKWFDGLDRFDDAADLVMHGVVRLDSVRK